MRRTTLRCVFALNALAAFAAAGAPTTAWSQEAHEDPPALYKRGQRYFDVGEFGQAIEAFKRAYELSGAPELIFNLAQAHRLAGDYQAAQREYATYLRLRPDSPYRKTVERLLSELALKAARTPERSHSAALASPPADPSGAPPGAPPPGAPEVAALTAPAAQAAPVKGAAPISGGALAAPPERLDVTAGGAETRWLDKFLPATGIAAGGLAVLAFSGAAYYGLAARSAARDARAVAARGDSWTAGDDAAYRRGALAARRAPLWAAVGGLLATTSVSLLITASWKP